MNSLSDYFPDSFKKDFSNRNFNLGSVLRIFDNGAQKEKWHIIVGFNSDRILTATVRINSEENTNVFRTPYLRNLCYHLTKANNEFLEWDSIVDCSKLIEWDTSELLAILSENPSVFKGNLREVEFDTIRSIIATARTIEPKRRKKYGLE